MPLARLESRALVRVSGEDARPFLHNLLTQSVDDMAPGDLRFAALLTPQGRLLHDLFVHAEPEGALLLDCAADQRPVLLQRLTMYRLRAKAMIEVVDDLAVWACWPSLAVGAPDPRLPALGSRLYAAAAPAPLDAQEPAYDAHRLSLGVPDPARDRTANTYPIEQNLDLLHGVDFKKGCFIGQETTSRMHRRGQVKTRMLPIAFAGPSPAFGAEVLAGDLRAGEVLTGVEGRAMALLRLDRIQGAALTADGRPIRVERPAWWPFDS
jgi:folate-binding protein YgfZ